MGLDAVELLCRAEEFFAITITDPEASRTITVGDFYRLVYTKLDVTPLTHPETPTTLPVITEVQDRRWLRYKATHLPPPPDLLPWTPETVWIALVTIFVDQQGLKPHEVQPEARLQTDLGID